MKSYRIPILKPMIKNTGKFTFLRIVCDRLFFPSHIIQLTNFLNGKKKDDINYCSYCYCTAVFTQRKRISGKIFTIRNKFAWTAVSEL